MSLSATQGNGMRYEVMTSVSVPQSNFQLYCRKKKKQYELSSQCLAFLLSIYA